MGNLINTRLSRLLFLLITLFFDLQNIKSISLVYNLKIRRSFTAGTGVEEQKKSHLAVSVVPIVYQRNRHIVDEEKGFNLFERRRTNGGIFNFRYSSKKHWWLEFTTGIENERACTNGTPLINASRTGFDDFVISGGYNFFPSKKSQVVLYGLTGFPSKWKVNSNEIFDTLVGTRFFTLGFGSEFSYSFISKKKNSFVFIFQNRFLHLFDRKFQPIVPANGKIIPGNVTDLFYILRYRHKKDIFETGYNQTFFTNAAVKLPDCIVAAKPVLRHSFYSSYTRLFKELPLICKPGAIGTGINIGRAKALDTKIFIWWVNFTVLF